MAVLSPGNPSRAKVASSIYQTGQLSKRARVQTDHHGACNSLGHYAQVVLTMLGPVWRHAYACRVPCIAGPLTLCLPNPCH